MTKEERVKIILKKLRPLYKNDPIEIDYNTPFNLIVGVILSAQCTDVRVNKVTKTFFDTYKTPQDYLKLKTPELEELIRSTGFYRNKAKNIQGCAAMLVEDFDGKIPNTMKQLVKLPGFGRKTANVILGELFQKTEGICVDTHVLRLSKLLELTQNKDAVKVERDLMEITPKRNWKEISHFLILHGRRVCFARNPECEKCALNKTCPSALTK